jgi:hypothetical protein
MLTLLVALAAAVILLLAPGAEASKGPIITNKVRGAPRSAPSLAVPLAFAAR